MRRTATLVLVQALFLVLASIAARASSRPPAGSATATHHAVSQHTDGKHAIHSRSHQAKPGSEHPVSRASIRRPMNRRSRAAARECRVRAAAYTRRREGGAHPLHAVAVNSAASPQKPAPDEPKSADNAAPRDNAADNAGEEADAEPPAPPASFPWRPIGMPPPLRGSVESLQRQNQKAEDEGLQRIEDEDDLADRIAHKLLVPVPVSDALTINGNLPENHRYCRPWTARFLTDLARAHAAQFHSPLEVSSAVRTVEYQKRLMTVNGNAAAAEGDIVSPHLTGATIDIAKSGMTRQQIGWMRSWLAPLQDAGKIDVEEEFHQACFHITVYKSYVPARPPASVARSRPGQPAAPRQKAAASGVGHISRVVAGVAPALGS